MDNLTEWLLEGPPWVQFRVRVDLLGQAESDPQVQAARQAMVNHPQVRGLVADLAAWPGTVLNSHKSAGHLIHKLTFAADLGLKASDPGMDRVCSIIRDHPASEGPFQVLMNIPQHFGGPGEDRWAWALCDAPLITSSLIRFGLQEDPRVRTAVEYMAGLSRDNGWPCKGSSELGKFRGPGRKEDPCPYATLGMLKTLSLLPEWSDSKAARDGCEVLLAVWDDRVNRHPYMFFMGTDFCKLKAPLVWFDIVHVLEVLTRFPQIRADARLKSMLAVMTRKMDAGGLLTPESIWTAWKDWDFGQKKIPSPWLTLLVHRIIKRMGGLDDHFFI